MLKYKSIKNIALVLTITALSSQGLAAKDLRMASGVPAIHPAHEPLYTLFQEQLSLLSDGRLTTTLIGTEVTPLSGMRTGLTSGLINIGLFVPAYFPADLPEINLIGDLAFLGKNPQAMAAAMTEYVVTCDDCQAELRKLGITYTSSLSTEAYHLLSTKPIRDLADLKGVRLRVGGPQFSRWAVAMGARPVNAPIEETFGSLSHNIIYGGVISIADLVSLRLEDAIKYVTTINLGTYFSVISHSVALNTWESLSLEDRKAIAIASTVSSTQATNRWSKITDQAYAVANQNKIKIIESSEELLAATAAFVENDLTFAAREAGERYKVKNAEAKIDRFRQLINKWAKIAETVNNDATEMAKAQQREIWDKVDFITYGL